MSNCIKNPYTTLCTSTIYKLISGLESLMLPIYNDIILDDTHPTPCFYSIFPIKVASISYVITQSNENNEINFLGINMSNNNVLTADFLIVNIIPVIIVNYRGKIFLKYKNNSFEFRFVVPFIDELINTKKIIQNLFNDNIKSFVLFDKLVFIFAKINDDLYYRFVYAGILNHNENGYFIIPKTFFDFNDGTLVGLFDKFPYFSYNSFGIQSFNYYPYSNYLFGQKELFLNYLIVGGINNYFIQPVNNLKPKLWKICNAFELHYQTQYLDTDNKWGYCPLKSQILIEDNCKIPKKNPVYIVAFNNNVDPDFVFLGTTDFFNTDNTIITFAKKIIYIDDPSLYSWKVYPDSGKLPPENDQPNLYFYYDNENVYIYKPTINLFLIKYKGAISIQDLLYSFTINEHYLKIFSKYYSISYDENGYNKLYKNSNFYFESEFNEKEFPKLNL